jgi:hypothetical protein
VPVAAQAVPVAAAAQAVGAAPVVAQMAAVAEPGAQVPPTQALVAAAAREEVKADLARSMGVSRPDRPGSQGSWLVRAYRGLRNETSSLVAGRGDAASRQPVA